MTYEILYATKWCCNEISGVGLCATYPCVFVTMRCIWALLIREYLCICELSSDQYGGSGIYWADEGILNSSGKKSSQSYSWSLSRMIWNMFFKQIQWYFPQPAAVGEVHPTLFIEKNQSCQKPGLLEGDPRTIPDRTRPPTFWFDCWNPLQTELNYLW